MFVQKLALIAASVSSLFAVSSMAAPPKVVKPEKVEYRDFPAMEVLKKVYHTNSSSE